MRLKIFTNAIILVLLTAGLAFSQVPAEQDTIEIPSGIANIGLIEATINGDADASGNRINPQRVYKLMNGDHYIQSQILFGGDDVTDTTSTLIIVGEKGGNIPLVLHSPLDDGDNFRHQVHGSLVLKNLYWPCKSLTNKSSGIFAQHRANQRLVLEDFVTENTFSGDVFVLRNVTGEVDIFMKNVYFRDGTQFENSWNFTTFARGNGLQIDTLWIENTTLGNSGMGFFGKDCPVNMFFFDHNTIINTHKYPIWMERNKEAYITNNLWINANYEGECRSTWETQLSDGVVSGIVLQDTITADMWVVGNAPAQEDVIWLASNNLKFDSPFLDKYWSGGYNDVADHPISNRQWGDVLVEDLPLQVFPTPFISERTQGLIDDWPGIVEVDNIVGTDPQFVTKGIADQATADLLARQMRKNYQVADTTGAEDLTFEDRVNLWFGDGLGSTVPGGGTETGGGFPDVRDLPEDFSYASDIRSTIDGLPLGSLAWWDGLLDSYDSDAALQAIKEYYASVTSVEKTSELPSSYSLSQNYPNPFNPTTTISFSLPVSGLVKLGVYNVLGQQVAELVNEELSAGTYNYSFDASKLSSGVYVYKLNSNDFAQTRKMILLK